MRARAVPFALAVGLLLAMSAWAQEPAPAIAGSVDVVAPAPTAAPVIGAQAAESAAFEAHVDGVVAAILAREHIAGMVVSVVRDDTLLLAKGYGQAVLAPARAADGEASLFRIGSISKTFAYVAATQLLAAGKLGLDDPVNDHLPPALRLPDDGFAEPIRIRHLLTHTAGFEDSALGHLFVRDADQVLSSERYLVEHRPRRVRAPGAQAVYSNYSLVVLGAVIAQASGSSYIDYIEQNLTGPLGMARSTLREPLPAGDPRRIDAALGADLASGYRREEGAFEPGEFEFIVHAAAAGGMSSTARDMSRWMRMLLNAGELDGVRVLPDDAGRALREVMFRNAEHIPGIAHGFLTENFGPYTGWGHGGATLYFHSAMVMIPERHLGVFVSANTDIARAPVREVARLLIERLLPDARPTIVPVAQEPASLARYAGTWRSNRRAYSTVEKLLLGLGSDSVVSVAADGSLRISGGEDTSRWLSIGPGLFQEAEGNARLQFLDDANGLPDRYVAGFGVAVNERVAPWQTAAALFGLLALALLLALARVARSFRRERRGNDPRPGLAPVKWLAIVSALAWIAFVVALGLAAVGMLSEGNAVVYTYPSQGLRITLWLSLLAAVLTSLEVLALWPVWRGNWRAWPKLRYTLAVALMASAVGVMCSWNLVGVGT